jgi:DivIVA domain-containing protein
MELSPQSVASTTFKTVKKGYDPEEVRAYLAQLATAIESTQAQATAMEARARAAVARLQELAANPAPAAAPATATSVPNAGVDEAETISRTLLLAQRTADTTVADAEADAKRIREEADAEARYAVESAREVQNRLIEEAKVEARRAAEGARIQVESEVQALLARREFLLSDVDHLEQHVITHRDRLREVAGALTAIVDRGPGGLADLRRPLMSAVTDDDASADESAGDAPDAEAAVDATQPMSRLDWLPEESPAETDTTSADDATAEPARADEPAGESTAEAGSDAEDESTGRPADATPPAGLFDEVTSEVPMVSRPGNDAFRMRGDDRR